MNRYFAFGLTIHSDLIFPELFPSDSETLDLEIRQSDFPEGEAAQAANGQRLALNLRNIGDFVMEGGRLISYRRREGVDDDTLRLYLLGSCLGCILQQRGYVVLHGNAVSSDGETCKIIVGHRGAGKSTSAAWHYLQGDKVLADDVCAIGFDVKGAPMVFPSYPQIKLWKASADLLGIDTNGLRRIRSGEDKFAVPLADRFCRSPLPLTEIVELSALNSESRFITGAEKARCLKEHSYRYPFVKRMGLAPAYVKQLINLAGSISIRTGVRLALNPPPAQG